MPHGAKPTEAQTGWAKGRHRKRRHPSGQEGQGKAETSWTHVHAMQQMGMGQDKPKCCKLDTQSDPDSTVEEGCIEGAGWERRSGLDCASDPAQGMWKWWWQEARGV